MPKREKFLTLAVKMGKIREPVRTFVLNEQSKQRLRSGKSQKAGDVLIAHNLLDRSGCEEVYNEQQRRSSVSAPWIRRHLADRPSLRTQHVTVAVLALAGTLIAKFKYDLAFSSAASSFSLLAIVASAIVEYVAQRPLLPFAFRVSRWFLIVVGGCLITYAAVCFWRLDTIIAVHGSELIQTAVSHRLMEIKVAFAGLLLLVLILVLYAIWKFNSLRFAEARIGEIKDLFIRVESTLQDTRSSVRDRQRVAVAIVLKALRSMIKLSASDRILRKSRFYRQPSSLTTVLLLVPEPEGKYFRIEDAAYPENAPEPARDAFQWIRENHRPCFLNEAGFEEHIRMAKGEKQRGWRKRYLNFPNRSSFTSVAGWISAKQQTLVSKDAQQCLAFDYSFLEKAREQNFTREALRWVEVGSFLGCPIAGSDGQAAGVLLVLRNLPGAVGPEDLEVTIMASQVLNRISRFS